MLEHLATFTVSPENDLVYPADGMRRLLAMEKTSGIWTQKVMRNLGNLQNISVKNLDKFLALHYDFENVSFCLLREILCMDLKIVS